MKTFNNFYEDIIALPNLYRAYELARRGKRRKTEVLNFENNLHSNLLNLHFALLERTYSPSGYKTFYVTDSKKRKITAPAFSDQIVHHAIFNFVEQMYDQYFIYDSYACRKNKGTHRGFKRLMSFVRKNKKFQSQQVSEFYASTGTTNIKPSLSNKSEDYFMKCDISKYFYSIDQHKLKEIISRKIKDENVLWLMGKIIDSHSEMKIPAHVENNYYFEQRKGIPIGNLTSQLFSNIYLNELDYFVKNNLRIKHYVRYVDDFVIIEKDAKLLQDYFRKIKLFLSENLFLKLEKEKTQINKISFGVDFIGFVAFKHYSRVRSKGYRKFVSEFKANISLYHKGLIEFNQIYESFISYRAHLMHSNSSVLFRRVFIIYHSAQIKKAVYRGGSWNNGANAGPFAANLNNGPTNTNTNIGFRCCSAHEMHASTSRSSGNSHVHNFAPSLDGENFAKFSTMKTGAGTSDFRGFCDEKLNWPTKNYLKNEN